MKRHEAKTRIFSVSGEPPSQAGTDGGGGGRGSQLRQPALLTHLLSVLSGELSTLAPRYDRCIGFADIILGNVLVR